jgi:uncharacterized protein
VILADVNILVYAFREDAPDHLRYKKWLEGLLSGDEPFALSDHILSSFLRIVTHPQIFKPATPLETALSFVDAIRNQPHRVSVSPGPAHWEIFVRLARATSAMGNHLADTYLAALAIESGSEFVTSDRDYSRYPGLRWRHPLQS